MISPAQCRGARGFLRWSQMDLAAASGISDATIRTFENETRAPHSGTTDALQAALEAAGIEVIPENGGGPGVRLR